MTINPMTIGEIQAAVQSDRLTAEQSIAAALQRMTAWNGKLKAFVVIDADRAMADARHLDQLAAMGVPKGPLFGVPLAIKDIIDVAGLRTGGGSLTRKDAGLAQADAEVVTRLRNAGAIIMGKVGYRWIHSPTIIFCGHGGVEDDGGVDSKDGRLAALRYSRHDRADDAVRGGCGDFG